jgi:uncharacterized protein YndB with AHSA1/START domain
MTNHHETIQLKQEFSALPDRVFRAFVDVEERQKWSAPSDATAVLIDHSDVRTGGSEATRCGSKDNLRFRTEVHYHLVEENRTICFAETLFEGDKVLMAALVTFDFGKGDDGGTLLTLTDQITSFVGPEGIEGHRQGFAAALGNLALLLASSRGPT